jgi:hypothetical protein
MILFDFTSQTMVGSIFALSRRESLARDDAPLASRAFREGLLFCALLYVPSAAFFHYNWPGWNLEYVVDPARVGGWGAFVDGALLELFYIVGFLLTARALRRNGGRAAPVVLRLALLWLAVLAFLVGFAWSRSFTVGSYGDFLRDPTPPFRFRWGAPHSIFGSALMWWLFIWAVIDYGPLLWLYLRGRRAPA